MGLQGQASQASRASHLELSPHGPHSPSQPVHAHHMPSAQPRDIAGRLGRRVSASKFDFWLVWWPLVSGLGGRPKGRKSKNLQSTQQ